jgi:hypothetical protein
MKSGPDFIIIGAQKCGTTSLYHYLIQHSQIQSRKRKELHFFTSYYGNGLKWYQQFFRTKKVCGESTPYYLFHPNVAERIALAYPTVKLIVLLREPVERAFSHYNHEVSRGFEPLSFETAIAIEETRLATGQQSAWQHYSYVARGKYAEQLGIYRQYFDYSQILLLKSEDFFAHPQATVDLVTEFLELKKQRIADLKPQNEGEYLKAAIPSVDTLRERFAVDLARLQEQFGITWQQKSQSTLSESTGQLGLRTI